MKAKLFSLLFLFSFYQCHISQNAISPSRSFDSRELSKHDFEPGKCYAKCLISDQYELFENEYVVYTGDESEEDVDLEEKTIEVKPAASKWVKKKADKNCLSADPNDCLVWCLVKSPAETVTVKILKDTSQSKNYEIRSISSQEVQTKGGHTEYREILCEQLITEDVVYQIQQNLLDEGFLSEPISFKLDSTTKKALSDFQRTYRLPVGQLDIGTLKALKVNY